MLYGRHLLIIPIFTILIKFSAFWNLYAQKGENNFSFCLISIRQKHAKNTNKFTATEVKWVRKTQESLNARISGRKYESFILLESEKLTEFSPD